MTVEIEFKTDSVNASQISQNISTSINSVKKQGLDAREFGIETNIGSDGSQFPQKISSVLNFMEQQTLKTLSYAFSSFSIILVGYILIDTFLNYPPKMIGISP
jgi:hypothetical protein